MHTAMHNKSRYKCNKSCKGRIISDGKYCNCIEKRLPRISRRSVKARSIDPNIIQNIMITPLSDIIPKREDMQFTQYKLRKFGLSEFEVILILSRFYEGKTFEEIVKEQCWRSISSVEYYFKRVLSKLRKGKFKLK